MFEVGVGACLQQTLSYPSGKRVKFAELARPNWAIGLWSGSLVIGLGLGACWPLLLP